VSDWPTVEKAVHHCTGMTVQGSNLGRGKKCFSENSRPALGRTQPPMGTGVLPGWGKTAGAFVNISPPCIAEVKNEWSYTSLGVDRDNFTITIAL